MTATAHRVFVVTLTDSLISARACRAARVVAAAAALAGLAAPALAGGSSEVAIRPVAVTGTPAPGTPAGVQFWLFTTGFNHDIMHPVIDAQGRLAFTGRVTGPGVDATNRNGLWAERPAGATTMIVRSGTQAPGTPAGVLFSGFSNDYIPTPPLAAGGRLAFQAEVVGPGTTFGNNSGIWKETAGGIALVARQGDPALGLGAGATFSADLYLTHFNNAQHVLLKGAAFGPGITADNDEMLWSDRSGSLLPIIREGMPAPGLNGLTIGVGQLGSSSQAIPHVEFNGQSRVFIQGNLKGSGVTAFNDEALWVETAPGQLTLVAREGQSAPGIGGNATLGGQGVTLGIYTIDFNDLGHVAFTSDVDAPNSSTTAIFSTHTGALAPVAAPGTPAPGLGYNFAYAGNPRLSNAGRIAFAAAAPDNDGDPFTPPPIAIWSDRFGTLAPVVHPGDEVLGREGATVIGTSFIIGFNSEGQVAFRAGIQGAPGYADTLFLSGSDGVNHLIVATGDAFDVFGDGSVIRTVERIVTDNLNGLSENGQVAFRLDFTDTSSGHYVARLAPACPADVNDSGSVDVNDLLAVITGWGTCPPAPAACPGDTNHSGSVDVMDLLSVITTWGPCP